MNKKDFLKTYKNIDKLKPSSGLDKQKAPIYRSAHDERLIKEFHYAKFQKNLQQAQQNSALKQLLNKDEWSEEDTKVLLESLR